MTLFPWEVPYGNTNEAIGNGIATVSGIDAD